MEVGLNKVKADFETHISDLKTIFEIRVAEIQKESMEKVAEMCGLQEIQSCEILKLNEEVVPDSTKNFNVQSLFVNCLDF